jgi:hypothetical protein
MAASEGEKTEKITVNLGLVDLGLALATIASVEVLGAFRAPTAVKAALAARTA